MAKLPTITTITSANDNITTHNANYASLRSAFTNFLSRDGETPNTMTADLDMNSQQITNAGAVRTAVLYIAGEIVNSIGNLANWGGEWTTSTAYEAYDIVYHRANNTIYRCLLDHTSGTFATDLTAVKWEVYIGADAGIINQAAVAITGGTIAGLTSLQLGADTVHTGTTGADVDLVSGTAGTDGNLAQWNADGDVVDGPDVLDEDDMTSDSATAVATQQSIKAYVDTEILAIPANETIVLACSDETTDLTTGGAAVTFRMPFAMTVSEVRASVTTAPTGATIQVDVNEGGVSIFSTPVTIDVSEFTSTTAATPAVISDTALADDAEMTIDIDQIGSTVAGTGLKVTLIGTRA